MRSPTLADLQALQAKSLGFVLIRCGQLFNEWGMALVNAESGGAPMMREAHSRLVPHLQEPGGIRITELARRIGVTKQAVQQLLADLITQGIVRVSADPDDARARRIELTSKGLAAVIHGTGTLISIENQLAAVLGKRDLKTLHALLTRLLPLLTKVRHE